MSNTTELPMKMLISTEELRSKLSSVSSDQASSEYIIMQNNKLHAQLASEKEQMVELNKQIEEFEEEVDSLTKSRTCLQGYVKNEVELAQNWKKLANIHKKSAQDGNAYTNGVVCTYMITLILLLLLQNQTVKFWILVTNVIALMYVHTKEVHKCRVLTNSPEKKKLIASIKKTEQSNTYIQELIDNI